MKKTNRFLLEFQDEIEDSITRWQRCLDRGQDGEYLTPRIAEARECRQALTVAAEHLQEMAELHAAEGNQQAKEVSKETAQAIAENVGDAFHTGLPPFREEGQP